MERSRRRPYPSLWVCLYWQLLLARWFILERSKEIEVMQCHKDVEIFFDNVAHVSLILILDVSTDFVMQKQFPRCFADSNMYVKICFCPAASVFFWTNFVAFQVITSLVYCLGMIFSHSHNASLKLPSKRKQPSKNFVTKYKIWLYFNLT